MLKIVAEVYNDGILQQALKHFDLVQDQVALIDSNTNVVFEYRRGSQEYILKIIHSSQAPRERVSGELDWIDYLNRNGAPVPKHVRSREGNLVEVVEAENSYFSVVAYQKGGGIHVGYEENEKNSTLFQTCGRVVGQMHALAKDYVPSDPAIKRPEWDEVGHREFNHPDLASVYDRYHRLADQLYGLPKDRDSYGMIHGDFHAYNFSVHENGISVFDFTDCNYAWFAYELGIILYHVVDLPYMGNDPDGFGGFFMEHFMRGYKPENRLDRFWEDWMPVFLKMREIHTYNYIYCNWDLQNYPEDRKWMEACRARIDADRPFVDIPYDFS